MSVQLYNDTASIRLVRGSDVYNIDRGCDLRVYGSQLHITTAGGKEIHVIEFSEVTVPVVANIAALRTAVEAWKEDTISVTTDVDLSELLDSNNGTFDAFYRQRFFHPETIFDSKQLADNQPIFWDDAQTTGSGTSSTYNTNQASTTIAVSNLTAGTRVRQTYRRFMYQPGKSQLWIQTGVWGAAATGITRRAGLFDNKNGVFFEQTSSGMGVVVRTYTSGSAVDTRVAQASWNIDKMDGTGASGITLDFTKSQIWFCDFEWLGVGRVRFGFFVNGRPYYVHQVLNTNNLALVYMSTPNLPLRYEIVNSGTGAAASFVHICSTVISEGGLRDTGYPFGVNRGATPLTTLNDTDIYPLFAMRLKSGYEFASVKILDMSVVCTSTSAFNYTLLLNPTVTGTALSFTSVTNSSIEVDSTTTNATKVSGGRVLFSGTDNQANFSSGVTSVLNSDFYFGSSIAGVNDVLVIAVQRLTGTTESFYGSINWKDQQ